MEGATLTLPILVGAALIDSANPCAFGILIFLLAYLLRTFPERKKLLIHGFTYIFAVFITYLTAGLILLPVIRQLGTISTTAYLVIAAIIIMAGILEVKDFFFYGRGPTLALIPGAAKRIEIYVKRITGKLATSFFLGIFVALVELPCTGAVYLGVLSLIALTGLTFNYFLLLIFYNLLFVLPLIVILLAVYKTGEAEKLEDWRKKLRTYLRLAIGILLIGMGIWMIAFVL